MPITPHANGEPLLTLTFFPSQQRLSLLSGVQMAMVVLLLPKANSKENLLKDD